MNMVSLKKMLVLLVAVGLLAGCAQEKGATDGSLNPQATPTPTPGTTPTPTPTPLPDNNPLNNEAGSTVTFQYEDIGTLNTYVQTRPVNNPQNMKINVKLKDVGGGRYDGHVKLAYYDTGTYYIGIFNTTFSGSSYQPTPTSPVLNNQTYQNKYKGMLNSQFNLWHNGTNGKKVFRGFFQDKLGAVILIINGGVDQGDGGGYSQVNGEIWFKNFSGVPAAQSPTQCWFHFSPSPYACGAYYSCGTKDGTCNAGTGGNLYPNDATSGYTKLGSFQTLDKVRAFGN